MELSKKKTGVSVVITTYKRPVFLKRALDSVINQSYPNIEIIVVDDNDAKSTYRNETERLMQEYSSIKYIKNIKNMGSCISRNIGMEKSTSDILIFFDDDDEMLPNHIECLVNAYKKTYKECKLLAMVYSQCYIIDDNTSKVLSQDDNFLKMSDNALEYHLTKGVNPTSCILFVKQSLISVKGWTQIPCGQEDYLITKLFANNYKGISEPNRTVNIHYHNSGRISIGKNKINGLPILYNLKKKYFNDLSISAQKTVTYKYYINSAIAYKDICFKTSVKYFIKMLLIKPFNKQNISTFLILILGVNNYMKLKNKRNSSSK